MKMSKAFVAVSVVCAVATVSSATTAVTRSTMVRAAEVKWEDYAPGSALKVSKLWGDRTQGGPYGMFLKLPAGIELPVHLHSADYNGVTVQGTWVHWVDGAEKGKKELPVGSHVFQSGNEYHGDGCKAGADCILLITQASRADYVPKDTKGLSQNK